MPSIRKCGLLMAYLYTDNYFNNFFTYLCIHVLETSKLAFLGTTRKQGSLASQPPLRS